MDHVPQLQEGAGLYQPDPMNNFPSPRPYRNKMTPSPIRLPNGWAGEGSPGPTAIRSTPRLRMAVFRRCRPTPRSRPVAANGSLPAPNEERGALPLRPAERGAYRAISDLPTGGTYRLRPADSGDPTRRSSDPRPGTLPLRSKAKNGGAYRLRAEAFSLPARARIEPARAGALAALRCPQDSIRSPSSLAPRGRSRHARKPRRRQQP